MKRLFAVLLLVVLLISTACNQNGKTPVQSDFITNEVITENETYFENVYLFSDVIKTYERGSTCCRFYEDEFRIYRGAYNDDFLVELFVDTYDLTGKLLNTVMYDTEADVGYSYAAFTDDKGLLCMNYFPYQKTVSFLLFDSSLNFIRESETVECHNVAPLGGSLRCLENGNIVYFIGGTLIVFADMDAEPKTYNLPLDIEDVDLLPDGTYLLCSGAKFFIPNLETGEIEEWRLPDTGEPVNRLFITDENEPAPVDNINVNYHNGDIYIWDENKLSVYRDGVLSELIDFKNSSIDSSKLQIHAVGYDDCFYVGCQNILEQIESSGMLLYKTEVQRTKPREIIRVATIGIETFQYRQVLHACILLFNRDNFDYRIEWTDYDTYYKNVTLEMGLGAPTKEEVNQSKFEEDLLAGITYDLYIMPEQSENRIMLTEKNVLADMTPFLSELPVLGTVKSAYQSSGQIIAMPIFMKLSMLVTSDAVLPSDVPLTREALYALSESVGEGETLFADDVYENMKTAALYDFVDADNKTCSFDSEEFIDYLTFLTEVKEGKHTDTALSIVDEYQDRSEMNWYFITSEENLASRTQNLVKLSQFNCSSPDALAALHLQFAEQDIRYCGYPSDNGTSVVLTSDMLFSASSLSASPEGVEAFLTFLLGDYVQTSSLVKKCGLPVTERAMELVFPVGYQYFHGDSYMNYQDDHPDSIMVSYQECDTPNATLKGSVYEMLHITEEDCQSFIDFLNGAKARSNSDPTLAAIINEELSYTESGARSAAETAKILQGRVNIYINE